MGAVADQVRFERSDASRRACPYWGLIPGRKRSLTLKPPKAVQVCLTCRIIGTDAQIEGYGLLMRAIDSLLARSMSFPLAASSIIWGMHMEQLTKSFLAGR